MISSQSGLPADFVADDAADHRAADHADRAAREEGTADRADAGTDRRVLVARRHAAATAQAEEKYRGKRTDYQFLIRFHWEYLFEPTLECLPQLVRRRGVSLGGSTHWAAGLPS